MFGRRILVLVAVLMGLTALAASLAPPPQTSRRGTAARRATPGPPASSPAPAAAGRTVTARLRARGAAPRLVTARVGDTVDLTIAGNVIDTVVMPGLAVSEPVDAASPAQVQIYADTAGRYPIRLLDAGRRLGTLQVRR